MQNSSTVGPPPSYPHDFVAISKGFEYCFGGHRKGLGRVRVRDVVRFGVMASVC